MWPRPHYISMFQEMVLCQQLTPFLVFVIVRHSSFSSTTLVAYNCICNTLVFVTAYMHATTGNLSTCLRVLEWYEYMPVIMNDCLNIIMSVVLQAGLLLSQTTMTL